MKVSNRFVFLVVIAVFLLYLLFPSNNMSNDALGAAGEIKYHWNLFDYHHLLHNAFIRLLSYPIIQLFPNIEMMKLVKFWSAIFSSINLLILYKILLRLKPSNQNIIPFLLLPAFSFGIWRFSIDFEFYILPISFSLLASYFLLLFLSTKSSWQILFSGFFAAFACLFHQVHFFWWLGIAIGLIFLVRDLKAISLFLLPAAIVPLTYSYAVYYTYGEWSFKLLTQYTFHFYATMDSVHPPFRIYILFWLVGIWRSFLELYPSILFLLKKSIIFYLPLVLLFGYIIVLIQSIQRRKFYFLRNKIHVKLKAFGLIHLLIIVFFALFSLYSVGNSEFMVSVPILLSILIYLYFEIHKKLLLATCILLFTWNFMWGVIPLYAFQLNDGTDLAHFIAKKPDAYFVIADQYPFSAYSYFYGVEKNEKILFDRDTPVSSIDSLLKQGFSVYTNVIDAPTTLRRGAITGEEVAENEKYDSFQYQRVDSVSTLYGPSFLWKLSLR